MFVEGARSFLGRQRRGGVAWNFVASVALRVSQTLLGLIVTIVFARTLGPAGYGIYSLALAVAILLAIPAESGLATLVVREVARYQLLGEWGLLRGLLRRSTQFVLGFTLIVVPVAMGALWAMAGTADGMLVATMAFALALVPLTALGNLRGAALIGLGKLVQGQLPETLLRPALLTAFAGAAVWIGDPTPAWAMGLHSLAASFAFLFGVVMLRRNLPTSVDAALPIYKTGAWARSVLPLSVLVGTQVIYSQTSVVLLGWLASTEDVGIYRVATQGAVLVAFPLIAMNTVLSPMISRLYHAGDMARLQHLVTLGARAVLAAALPLVVVFIFFGERILELVFGQGYSGGALALAILCLGQLVNAATACTFSLLNMTGHERYTARGMAVAAIVNIVLNLVLIPWLGIAGAAISTAVCLAGAAIFYYRETRKRLGIDSAAIRLFPKGEVL